MPKAAAKLPQCLSFDDEPSVVAFERAVRVHRAKTEPVAIGAGPEPGSFAVRGSGGAYFVDVVTGDGGFASCTCPDFLFATLGTCKHVEAVRLLLRKKGRRGSARPGSDLPAKVDDLERPVLTACADGELRLVLVDRRGPTSVASVTGVLASHEGRVTHAARAAVRILTRRQEEAERRSAASLAIERGELGVDVLASPLFPYQKEGVAHLVRSGRAVLADDMGLGKTVQTIAACEVLRRRGEARRVLIVCPASLKAQWASEIAKYAGAQAVVVVGGVEARRAAFAADAPYVVLNYELTWRDLSILKTLEPDVLVLDEAQRARNFRTKTAATLRSIPSRFLFVLTGTPIENRLDDLYGILQLVDARVLGPLWRFNLDFHERDEKGKVVGYRNLGELRRRIAPVVLRRRKEAVLSQLPALTEQTRYVELSPDQVELEANYRRNATRLLKIAEKRALSPSEQKALQAALLKARQACNAAVLCDPQSNEVPVANKIEELAALVSEIAEQGTSKVLVFSEWTEMLAIAARKLDAIGIGHLTLHGGVPTAARPALLERFRHEEDKVVLLSTDAGGVGLNLQVASYIVHLDLPWNPARLDQRTSRAHRLGQTRGVSVTYLCAESGIERGIEGTLAGKRALRHAATEPESEVEELEAPSFTQFLREARSLLDFDVGAESEPSAAADVPIDAEEESPRATLRSTADARPDAQAAEAFALQRLRLAHVVLDAGFPADAVCAAYEAIAASLRARITSSAVGEDHSSLVAAIYRELLPSGAIPSTLPATLAKVHDLAVLAEAGIPIEADIAKVAVEDARGWLERGDALSPSRP